MDDFTIDTTMWRSKLILFNPFVLPCLGILVLLAGLILVGIGIWILMAAFIGFKV